MESISRLAMQSIAVIRKLKLILIGRLNAAALIKVLIVKDAALI